MAMDLKKAMAMNVRRARQARELTQEELADRAGLSVRYLGSIERGKVSASVTVLGQVAQASGALTEAHTRLGEALETFTAIQSRFETGRTHLALAELAHAQGNREAATAHANNAYALFMALKIPRYVERTQQFASQCGLVLSNADILHE